MNQLLKNNTAVAHADWFFDRVVPTIPKALLDETLSRRISRAKLTEQLDSDDVVDWRACVINYGLGASTGSRYCVVMAGWLKYHVSSLGYERAYWIMRALDARVKSDGVDFLEAWDDVQGLCLDHTKLTDERAFSQPGQGPKTAVPTWAWLKAKTWWLEQLELEKA